MKVKSKIIIGIIIAAIAIPLGIYTISPLFINTEINEPLPSLTNEKSSIDFAKFTAMTENEKLDAAKKMTVEEKDMIMRTAAEQNTTTINEPMAMNIDQSTPQTGLIGNFIGVGDGIHNAEGLAKILILSTGSPILRLEDFKSTNGPDVHLYLSNNKQANDFIDLGRLKANIGNQNYQIPLDTDFNKYKYVLIWCQPFSVLFGSAQLNSSSF
ncbi:MAG TPA: DM13 domain-containing protein [Nitrososphaeraceae archaeon]|nr:DM13 domain-containing protein [Nitrososphaeraceae archaeon]